MLLRLEWFRASHNRFLGLLVALTVPVVAICLMPIAYTVIQLGVAIEFLTRPCALAIIAVSMLIGCARGWIFHPVFDEDYWHWLARTPWRLGYPLPKGPLDLQWQELTFVAFLVLVNGLLALTVPPPVFSLVAGPIASYCLGMTVVWSIAVGITGHGKYVLLTLAVPLLFRLVGAPTQAFILCPVVMLLVARVGLQRSLADFPWPDIQRQRASGNDSKMIGWPANILAQSIPCFPLHLRSALPLSALIGGWCWYISVSSDVAAGGASAADLHGLVILATLPAVIARIGMFSATICHHFCIGLRFGRKRWFILKHDQIFVAPLVMVIASVLSPILLPLCFAVPQAVANGLTAGLVSIIGLAMGPNVSELYYTGEHSKFGGSISVSDRSKPFVTIGGD